MSFERVFVLLLVLACRSSCNYTETPWEHRCDPGSEIFACTVPIFLYKPNQNHSKLLASETVRKVRLAYPTDKVIVHREAVQAYDETLHAILYRPKAIQITYVSMQRFEVPLDLEYADFRYNAIEAVTAPEVNGSGYALRYLDLRSNELDRIDSLKWLVNLETLILTGNRISSLDGSVLRGFTKLSGLYLANNLVHEISIADLPATLEWLIVGNNFLGGLNVTGAHLPALKVLDWHNNLCYELDVSDLLSAVPNLEGIRLEGNYIPSKEAKTIMEQLVQAGVAHDKFVPSESEHEEEEDHYQHTLEKLKVQDHIISGMLAVVNTCVIGWGFYQVYKSKKSTAAERANTSSA